MHDSLVKNERTWSENCGRILNVSSAQCGWKQLYPTWILEWNLTTWLFPSMQIENVVQCLPHKSTRRARRANSNLRAGIKFQCAPIYKHLRQQKLSLCWCQGAETSWASNHGHARPVEHYGTKNPQRTQVCWTASWIPEHVQLKTQLLKAMQAISHASYKPCKLSPKPLSRLQAYVGVFILV